jgi:hypothetical protein
VFFDAFFCSERFDRRFFFEEEQGRAEALLLMRGGARDVVAALFVASLSGVLLLCVGVRARGRSSLA